LTTLQGKVAAAQDIPAEDLAAVLQFFAPAAN